MRAPTRALPSSLIALIFVASAARGQDASPPSDGSKDKPKSQVYTFYGLMKLEQDPNVSDEEKLREWEAFIERSAQQTEYAKKAVDKWKNAARIRLVEAANKTDRDPKLPPRDKAAKWEEVARLYSRTEDGRKAKNRAAYWYKQETKRLVEAAEEVEKARRPKVELIAAWVSVLDWVKGKGAEARAANRRINELQEQLYVEAQSVDRIARVDKQTKLEAWRDVLKGQPTAAQKKVAERRVSELEAELGSK